ncbi:hypothetical protein FHP25_01730 [Vineibacter terrae]|uniref:Uncharacterized protein n=1 Tax=Vineibacter terrae TaxID=2586908 RepID=A0A5C8PWL1_9HYPH|nr:hypothetical protein [Vineibacter terrae]TXL82441.1 hypothetical protein FHP25_01730 [Vineibacter terrae]
MPRVSDMVYPTLLLVAGILIVLGLGLYQKLSASVEKDVEHRDRREDKDTAATPDSQKRR